MGGGANGIALRFLPAILFGGCWLLVLVNQKPHPYQNHNLVSFYSYKKSCVTYFGFGALKK
jgi:hypothetical protein